MKTMRVKIDLPPRSYERLSDLKKKTEAASYSEVLKNALRLYEDMIAQYEDGKVFYVKDATGNLTVYDLFA